MVISHKHKYLFVELPLTGSTAIRRELRDSYSGEFILRRHATYQDFLKIANEEEKKYFVFSGIRNPLDKAVSLYFKYKTDHKNRFTAGDKFKKHQDNFLNKFVDGRSYRFIIENDADFATYFKKFYKVPYNDWSSLSHKEFDFIIRFEHLAEDFARVIQHLGLEQVRPLPQVNKTGKKKKDFALYYTPDIIPQAKRVFGPFMKEWGYEFPREWGDNDVPWWNQLEFQFVSLFGNVYWRYIR